MLAGRPAVFPFNRIGWRGAIIRVIHAALSQSRQDGEVGRSITQAAVGANQRHSLISLCLIRSITGGRETDVTRPRRGATDQAGDIATVADTFTRLRLRPDILVKISIKIWIKVIRLI